MVELSGTSQERAAALSRFEAAMRFPVGSFSPLWAMFAGAASAGVAYWWMARWAKPANLEAMFGAVMPVAGAPVALEPVLEEAPASLEATVSDEVEIEAEALEAVALAMPSIPEAVVQDEPAVEQAEPEAVVEATEQAVEAAPEPAPKPAKKKTSPKAKAAAPKDPSPDA